MEFTGSYYQCENCGHIIDYMDSHCPECGSQEEQELNASEVQQHAELLLSVRDYFKNMEGNRLLRMLQSHGDLKPKQELMTAEEKTINKILYLHSVLVLESNKNNMDAIMSRIEKALKDYHKESSKELAEALEKLQEWHKKYPTGRIYNHSTSLILERELTEIVELQRKALENHLNKKLKSDG